MIIYDSVYSPSVMAPLNYAKPDQVIDYQDKGSLLSTETVIHNGRKASDPCSIDTCGFQLGYNQQLETILKDVSTADIYSLAIHLITTALPYKHHLLLSSVSRSSECTITPSSNSLEEIRPVANFVHADWGPSRLKRLGTSQDSIINYTTTTITNIREFIDSFPEWKIFNVWIPLNIVVNNALALCDKRSIQRDEYFEVTFKSINDNAHSYANSDAPILSIEPNAKQQWYYFPLMQPGEYLIFYQASANPSDDPPVMHTNMRLSFNAPTRHSIELRFLVA